MLELFPVQHHVLHTDLSVETCQQRLRDRFDGRATMAPSTSRTDTDFTGFVRRRKFAVLRVPPWNRPAVHLDVSATGGLSANSQGTLIRVHLGPSPSLIVVFGFLAAFLILVVVLIDLAAIETPFKIKLTVTAFSIVGVALAYLFLRWEDNSDRLRLLAYLLQTLDAHEGRGRS